MRGRQNKTHHASIVPTAQMFTSCIRVKCRSAVVVRNKQCSSGSVCSQALRVHYLGGRDPSPNPKACPRRGALQAGLVVGGGVRRVVSEYQASLGESQAGESNRDSHAMLLLLHRLQAAETPHVVLVRLVHLVVGREENLTNSEDKDKGLRRHET